MTGGVGKGGPVGAIEAVAFDLYGTLLALDDPLLHREVPRLLDVPGRRWLDLVRSRLLTTSFASTRELASFACRELAGERGAALVEACSALIERELASARPIPGALAVVQFLGRRGLKLGLLSNVSSSYKEPVARFGLEPLFDALLFSCDEGVKKPDAEIYLRLCARLEVEPDRVLVVGDSLANDVLAPSRLGMRTARVGMGDGRGAVSSVAELGLAALTGSDPCRALLAPGMRARLDDGCLEVTSVRAVSEDDQGRYNLVFEVEAEPCDAREPGRRRLFAKRYLSPHSAYVEELAYRLERFAGLPTCGTAIIDGPEPLLLVSAARGEKYSGELTPGIAHELARHMVFAFIFANGDIRPRNAFLAWDGSRPVVTMVDLEHCLFNLAIDVAQLTDPFNPHSIDALDPGVLARLVKRRVLTARTVRRARSEFFGIQGASAEVLRAFREGWLATFEALAAQSDEICGLLDERVYREPFLVIGTRSYRRAMARVDVADLRGRLAEAPETILDQVIEA